MLLKYIMSKFGSKSLQRYGLGVKSGVNGISKFGVKLSHQAVGISPLAGIAFGPEVGGGLAALGYVGETAGSLLEKATR
jgi:hypothetical protein